MPTDYELLAGRYDEDRERFSVPHDDVIDERLGSRAAVRVLDLGCGTGRWLAAQQDRFATSSISFLGIDPSRAMLEESRAKGLARLVRGQAEDLPFDNASVDYVVSSYTFHHFTDKGRALDEVARVLTGGGVFRIENVEPTGGDRWWVHQVFPETIAIDAARFWAPTRIADALEKRGFDVEVEVTPGVEKILGPERLVEAERRVVSQLALLDDEAYERGLARLREILARPDPTVATGGADLRVIARRR